MLVVMTDEDGEDSFEVPAVHDQDAVEAFAPYGADPAFDERVRAGCPYRCADRPDAFGAKHLIEGRRELAVAIVDQKPDRLRTVDERLDDVPCLLGGPLTCRIRGDASQIHLSGRKLDEDKDVESAERHGVDGEEVAGDDSARLGSQELPPHLGGPARAPDRSRLAAGSTTPFWPRSVHRAWRSLPRSCGIP